MRFLTSTQSESVRAGRVEYGMVARDTLKRSATCRSCGVLMPKGTPIIRFAWDFQGGGSWTAIQCVMHTEPCSLNQPRVHIGHVIQNAKPEDGA